MYPEVAVETSLLPNALVVAMVFGIVWTLWVIFITVAELWKKGERE